MRRPTRSTPRPRCTARVPSRRRSWPAAASFTLGISGILTLLRCQDRQVELASRILQAVRSHRPLYGAAMSPVVDGDKCIVHVGGPDKGALVAIDVKTGETLWSCGRRWARLRLADHRHARRRAPGGHAVAKSLRRRRRRRRQAAVEDPVSDRVRPERRDSDRTRRLARFLGHQQGHRPLPHRKQDDEWETDKIWENKEVSLYMSSPVTDGETLVRLLAPPQGRAVCHGPDHRQDPVDQRRPAGRQRFAGRDRQRDLGPDLAGRIDRFSRPATSNSTCWPITRSPKPPPGPIQSSWPAACSSRTKRSSRCGQSVNGRSNRALARRGLLIPPVGAAAGPIGAVPEA